MNRTTAGIAVLATLAFTAGCNAPHHRSRNQFEVRKSWPASGITELRVEGTNGRVEITADASLTEIQMVARCRAPKGRKEADVLKVEVDGDVLHVAEREHKRKHFLFGDGGTRIDFDFRVPVNLRLEIDSVNGRIDVDGVDGRMELTTVNGAIEVATPSGEVVARTVNGSVRADFLESFPGARLKTVNGSVKIRVPKNCRVSPEVRQVNGSFRSDIPVRINAVSQGDEKELEVTTVNGSVTLSELGGPSVPSAPELPEVPAAPERPEVPAAPEPPSPPAV